MGNTYIRVNNVFIYQAKSRGGHLRSQRWMITKMTTLNNNRGHNRDDNLDDNSDENSDDNLDDNSDENPDDNTK
jgi:hypothetical protein